MGHGQMGYGLGNLFRSLAKVVTPLVKKGAKALGNIAMKTGADLLGDVAAGKNVKEAVKAPVDYKLLTLQKQKLWNIYGKKHKQAAEGEHAPEVPNGPEAVNAPEVLNGPEVPKGQKVLIGPEVPNEQLKREKHLDQEPEADRPRNGKHLLRTYLVKDEFRTFPIARMHQERT
jgi:hypothetical protein